jgi:hypothetical protein
MKHKATISFLRIFSNVLLIVRPIVQRYYSEPQAATLIKPQLNVTVTQYELTQNEI